MSHGGSCLIAPSSPFLAWLQVAVFSVPRRLLSPAHRLWPVMALQWPGLCVVPVPAEAPRQVWRSRRLTCEQRPLLDRCSNRKGSFVLGTDCKIVSAVLFLFWPFLSLWIFSRTVSLLSGTSTPPPGRSKEPCYSSLLPAGPTCGGLTPSLHSREWLEYTFSWSSGR